MEGGLGKKFEEVFKRDWKECFPDSFLFRLSDQVSGYKNTSQNPCDFICFVFKNLFLIETKSHKGKSIPFQAIPQYERLLKYKGMENVHPGVIVWFIDYDKVIWCPIEELEKIKNDGKKSISLDIINKMLYNIIEIPSEKKITFLKTDYKYLVQKILEEEKNE